MSPETELSRDISGKLNVFFTDSDDEYEFSNGGNLVEEKKLEEIMQELYKEITTISYNTSPPPTTVTFQSPSSSSSSSPLTVSSSQPFFSVNVDVKSESCGASMSDSSSTVMAGIEFVGPAGKLPETGKGYSSENEVWEMGMGFVDDNNNKNNCNNNVVGGGEEGMEGCDEELGEIGDDQWLARVLRWGPLELEEWT